MCGVAGHIAEVQPKVVVAGRTGRGQSLGEVKLGLYGLQLSFTAAAMGSLACLKNNETNQLNGDSYTKILFKISLGTVNQNE